MLFRCIFILACFAPLQALAGEAIRLQQPDGTVLELAGPANRVVTLSPHLTELVFAAGAGDRLVATVEYSDFPAGAADIPRIGDAFRLDIERIIAWQPDLVIAWDSGNPKPAIEQLRSLDVPVWSVEIREPEQITDTLEQIGTAVGTSRSTGQRAAGLRRQLDALTARYAGVQTVSYFYQVGAKPLFTINGSHLISKGLERCGAQNVFRDEPGLAFQVAHESVIVSNPDALIAPWADGMPDPLARWKEWPAMSAVRQDALFLLPADSVSRATPRFLDSLELACNLLDGLRQRENNE